MPLIFADLFSIGHGSSIKESQNTGAPRSVSFSIVVAQFPALRNGTNMKSQYVLSKRPIPAANMAQLAFSARCPSIRILAVLYPAQRQQIFPLRNPSIEKNKVFTWSFYRLFGVILPKDPLGSLQRSFGKWPIPVNLPQKAKDRTDGWKTLGTSLTHSSEDWGFPIQTCTDTVPGSGASWPQFSCCFDTPSSII